MSDCITYDLTCTNYCIGQKYVYVFFMIFPHFKVFINIYRLLTVYRKIFGTSSYGEGCTSLRVHLRHMNECRIFYDIQSITFLLYTFLQVIYDW